LFSAFFEKVYCAWFAHSQIDGFPKQSLNTFFKGVSQKKILLLEIMRLVSTFFDYFLKREKNQSNFGGKEMSILWKKWEIWSCINHFFIKNIPREKTKNNLLFILDVPKLLIKRFIQPQQKSSGFKKLFSVNQKTL
jgi:hypothetical protein